MENDINLSFTDTKKLTKVYPVNKKNIFKTPENYHIFFCDGLILTKNIKNKFKITFFNKKNSLFNYINKTVYFGKFKDKHIFIHNISFGEKGSNIVSKGGSRNTIKRIFHYLINRILNEFIYYLITSLLKLINILIN